MELKRLNLQKQENNFIDYLEKFYEIKRNRFTNEIIIKRKKDGKQINKYDLILEAEQYGYNISKRKLDYYFKSSKIPLVNPFLDRLEQLPAWTPSDESQIKKLLNHLQSDGADRTKKILYKWLVNSILQLQGKGLNDVMLIFVSSQRQGIGKTYLTEKILSPFGFIKTGQSLLKNIENLPEATVKYPFIFYDEMKGLRTQNELLLFKTIISSQQIEYRKFTRIYKSQRIGNFIGTADSSELFFDYSGSRRFAVIELESINFDYARKVDFERLWSEAYYIARNDAENYRWTQKDYSQFEVYNLKYYRTSHIEFYINKYFSPGTEQDSLMTPTEILIWLSERIPRIPSVIIQKTDIRSLGITLKKLGFTQYYKRRDGKKGRYYGVKIKER